MIDGVHIENLRGIRAATLGGLTPLTVLVGPNGSGKSTVLDAVLLGGSRKPAAAAGHVVKRRSSLRHGARWLFRGGQEETTAVAGISVSGTRFSARKLAWSEARILPDLRRRLVERGAEGPYSAIQVEVADDRADVAFAADNTFESSEGIVALMYPGGRIVDPQLGLPLEELYSRITERGMRSFVLDLVRQVVPTLEALEVLTHHNDPRLHLTFSDGSVPVAVSGDGVRALLRICLELGAGERGGVYLLEEPEMHQHPGAMRQSAHAIAAAVGRGAQILLSTHSLELIDALLDHLDEAALHSLSLHRLRLSRDGVLATSRLEGAEILASRDEIKDDLR